MLLSPRQADRTALFYDLVHDDFLGNSFLKDNRCSAIAFDAKCRKLCLAHFPSRQFSCGSAISVENKRSPVIGGNKLDCGDFLFLGHIRSPFCVGVSFTPTRSFHMALCYLYLSSDTPIFRTIRCYYQKVRFDCDFKRIKADFEADCRF